MVHSSLWLQMLLESEEMDDSQLIIYRQIM